MNILAKFKNRRKHKVIIRLSNNKKFCVLKFNNQEFNLIHQAAIFEGITVDQFFINVIRDCVGIKTNEI